MANKTFVALGMLQGEFKRHRQNAYVEAEAAARIRDAIVVLQRGKAPTGEQVGKSSQTKEGFSSPNGRSPFVRTDAQRAKMRRAQKRRWRIIKQQQQQA